MSDTYTANKIKELRMNLGWDQQHLADVSGVSLRTLQRAESGRVTPRLDTLADLAAAFDVEVAVLRHPPQAPDAPRMPDVAEVILKATCAKAIESGSWIYEVEDVADLTGVENIEDILDAIELLKSRRLVTLQLDAQGARGFSGFCLTVRGVEWYCNNFVEGYQRCVGAVVGRLLDGADLESRAVAAELEVSHYLVRFIFFVLGTYESVESHFVSDFPDVWWIQPMAISAPNSMLLRDELGL